MEIEKSIFICKLDEDVKFAFVNNKYSFGNLLIEIEDHFHYLSYIKELERLENKELVKMFLNFIKSFGYYIEGKTLDFFKSVLTNEDDLEIIQEFSNSLEHNPERRFVFNEEEINRLEKEFENVFYINNNYKKENKPYGYIKGFLEEIEEFPKGKIMISELKSEVNELKHPEFAFWSPDEELMVNLNETGEYVLFIKTPTKKYKG